MAELMRRKLPASTLPGTRRMSGFSLIEVTIAFTILGVGLLALAGAQLRALQGNQSGRHLSQGALLAHNQLEELVRSNWTTLVPATWTAPINVATSIDDGQGGSVEQTYAVSWSIQDVIADETRSIDVRVSWAEADGRARSLAASTLRFNRENL